jgi:hypothetical protein
VKHFHPRCQICNREGHTTNVCEVCYYEPLTYKLCRCLGHQERIRCHYIPLVLDDWGGQNIPHGKMALYENMELVSPTMPTTTKYWVSNMVINLVHLIILEWGLFKVFACYGGPKKLSQCCNF